MSVHYAVVAPIGGGKTTALRRLVLRLGTQVAGVLSLRVPGGYDLWVVPHGPRLPYARRQPPGTPVGRFWIREDQIQLAMTLLEPQSPRLWVLDEVGPLEVIQRRGWYSWLQQRVTQGKVPVVVAVRRDLFPRFLRVFAQATWQELSPTDVDRLEEMG